MASLLLGAFEMLATDGSSRVLAEGASWGAPVPIETAVQSWLQDGAIVVTQGHDNREVNVKVRFYGTDLTALAVKEAALFAELEKPNTLTWSPGGGQPATVFVVVTSSLAQSDESMVGEVQAKPWRTYDVRLICEAFTRSAAQFTSVGVAPGGSTTTSLDTCAATTGWSATVDGVAGTVTLSGSTIAVSSAAVVGSHTLTLQKTFSATTSTTNLLMVDWLPTPSGGASLAATGDGVALPLFAEAASPTSGYTRSWFKVAAASLAVTTFTMQSAGAPIIATVRTLRLDNVSVTNVQPFVGTNRQLMRSLAVPGSARTQGSLAIESATAALGDTLVYVYPADDSTTGYSPPLRQFRTSGNTVTADANQVSGSTEPTGSSGITFTIPIGLFPPGEYLLMARMAGPSPGTVTFTLTTQTKIGSNNVGAQVTTTPTFTMTTSYQIFTICRMQLPTVDLDPLSPASMVLNITGGLLNPTLDEAWLFNTSIGALIRVDCGTGAGAVGGAARRLFIEPPTVTTPRPTVRIGHSADRSDSFFPFGAVYSWQFPEFKPDQVNLLVVTPNATDAVISLSGYARWNTNPAA